MRVEFLGDNLGNLITAGSSSMDTYTMLFIYHRLVDIVLVGWIAAQH